MTLQGSGTNFRNISTAGINISIQLSIFNHTFIRRLLNIWRSPDLPVLLEEISMPPAMPTLLELEFTLLSTIGHVEMD
jgi:hypothetical protein